MGAHVSAAIWKIVCVSSPIFAVSREPTDEGGRVVFERSFHGKNSNSLIESFIIYM